MTIQTATPTRLDESTAAAIQQALAAARAGRLQDACSIAERALANGGDATAINAFLGMVRLDLGEVDLAVQHLEIAHGQRPADLKIATNLANALIAQQRYDRAFEVVSRELALADPSHQLARIRGFVADQLQDFAAAVEALDHVVANAPDDWESWNNLGNARRGLDDWEGSADALKRSVEINPQIAVTRLNYGKALVEAGRLDEGEAVYRKMAADFPEDSQPLRDLHVMYKGMLRDEDALEAIEGAVVRDPGDLELLLAKASHLSSMHKMAEAEAAYRHAIDIEPTDMNAHLGLALVYELNNQEEKLGALVEEAAARGVGDNALQFIRAYHFRRTKQYEAGLAALETVPEGLDTPRRAHLLAQLLQGAGRYDEAFGAFSRMNELFREDPSMPEERAARYRKSVADSAALATPEFFASWREESGRDPRAAPVFLVGFPRSGTTLLDTMLMAHPDIEVMEEEPALKKAIDVLGAVERLPTAGDDEIRAAREAYFDYAASVTPLAPGKLLIDKNPLTMNLLPFIRRLFPDARIILALRHPCDVVLSCFMANFKLNDGMANFLRLETTAELYDLSFGYYERVQAAAPLPTHKVVYENVVADRETELRALFGFLGLDWHEAVMEHEKTAQKRGRIKTASYSQVVEPIYTRASGRWQNYRKHLEPVMPVLDPWIRKLGYSAES